MIMVMVGIQVLKFERYMKILSNVVYITNLIWKMLLIYFTIGWWLEKSLLMELVHHLRLTVFDYRDAWQEVVSLFYYTKTRGNSLALTAIVEE